MIIMQVIIIIVVVIIEIIVMIIVKSKMDQQKYVMTYFKLFLIFHWELLFDWSIRLCTGLKEYEWLLFEESPLLLHMESVTNVASIVVGTIPLTCIASDLKLIKH